MNVTGPARVGFHERSKTMISYPTLEDLQAAFDKAWVRSNAALDFARQADASVVDAANAAYGSAQIALATARSELTDAMVRGAVVKPA
jgi:hypothetical protein